MTRRARFTLYASAAFSLWVWTVLIWNMFHDKVHTVGFRAVHLSLAAISLGFAIATVVIARRSRSSLED